MIASPLEAMVRIRAATLTPSERRVLMCLADGLGNREIAGRLVVAEKTVKNHITRLLSKLHASSRTQAALLASLAEFCADGPEASDAVPVSPASPARVVPRDPAALVEEAPPDRRWDWDEAELQQIRERLRGRPWRNPDDEPMGIVTPGRWVVVGGVRRWVDGAA